MRLARTALLVGVSLGLCAGTASAVTVTGVDPDSGPESGFTQVTITGTGFQPGAMADFGGVPAMTMWLNPTTVEAMTLGGTGTVDVTVTNPDASSGTLPAAFTYIPPLTVTAVNPGNGPETGGTSVTVTGTGFTAGTQVLFGPFASPAPAASVVVVSLTEITCDTPAYPAGTVEVWVERPDPAEFAVLPSGFTYDIVPPPTVTDVSPGNGPETGGTSVTLTGTDFMPGATVTFGAGAAAGVVVAGTTQITCTSPPGAGVVDVTVTNADGDGGTLPTAFSYDVVPPPTVTDVSPGNGPETGGTTVTITGTGFMPGAWVYFGVNAAAGVSVAGPAEITCSSPPGFGTVDVIVMNADGDSGVLSGAFTYDVVPPPTVTDVSPGDGPEFGGTSVTITGTGFVDGAAVFFGVTAATGVSVVSGTEITCETPAGIGTVDVIVQNTDGDSDVLSAAFTYRPPPTVTAVDPDSGPESGFTVVTITGTGFDIGALAYFGGFPAISTTYVNATTVTAMPVPGTGTVDVTVTNPDAQSGTLPGSFTFVPAPDVSAVNPGNGPETGLTGVTITGTGFQAGALVAFGVGWEPATNVVVVSATEITCDTPPHPAGAVPVWVENPDTQFDVLADAYTYDVVPPPTVTDAVPGNGPETGGTSVTITGTGFMAGATVTFGGNGGAAVLVVSTTQITCETPPGTGVVDVTVTNADGDGGTLAAGFSYDVVPPPTVTDVSPGNGPEAGGTSVTITGTGFVAGATVTFGGVEAAGVSVSSGTEIACTTPAGSGIVEVEVTNTDGDSGTLPGGFTYDAPPGEDKGCAPGSAGVPAGALLLVLGLACMARRGRRRGAAAPNGVDGVDREGS